MCGHYHIATHYTDTQYVYLLLFVTQNSDIYINDCDHFDTFSRNTVNIKRWTSLHRSSLCSKLTRESGTDFPIPVVPGVADTETEKLIREKDEEVRHADHEPDSHHQHDHKPKSEHSSDQHEHSEPQQPDPETHSDHLADEALWESVSPSAFCEAHSGHVFWGWQWVASKNMNWCNYAFKPQLPCPHKRTFELWVRKIELATQKSCI